MFMSEREQDSVIASKTALLDKIDDNVFLSQFTEAFLFTLSRSNIPVVLVADPSRLPKADDQHFTVDFVQLEAEEYLEPSNSSFTTRKGLKYGYDYDLRYFSVNVWLKLNAQDSADYVYFKNDEISDYFRGTVTSLGDGKATMRTHFERIGVNDAYQLARQLGAHCATLYVEKLLTEYVCRSKGSSENYFIYNPEMNYIEDVIPLYVGEKESFERL